MDTNVLYYGDNLKILRNKGYFPDQCVDLIYLDPPFNSKATYNVLYKEPSGKPSGAQMGAFEDTWQWGLESERALQEIATSAKHLQGYLNEYDWRYNHRNEGRAMFETLLLRSVGS